MKEQSKDLKFNVLGMVPNLMSGRVNRQSLPQGKQFHHMKWRFKITTYWLENENEKVRCHLQISVIHALVKVIPAKILSGRGHNESTFGSTIDYVQWLYIQAFIN